MSPVLPVDELLATDRHRLIARCMLDEAKRIAIHELAEILIKERKPMVVFPTSLQEVETAAWELARIEWREAGNNAAYGKRAPGVKADDQAAPESD